MPQPFDSAVTTSAGILLAAKANAGQCKLQFVSIKTGSGIYTEAERTKDELSTRTGMKEGKNSYEISEIDCSTPGAVRVKAFITNQDPVTKQSIVTEGYYINEIGLYAKEVGAADDTAILYSIAVTAGIQGDFLSPYNGQNPAQIIQNYQVKISNAASISITPGAGAVALMEDVEEAYVIIQQNTDMIGKNITNILALDIALSLLQGAVVAGTSDNIFVETFEDDSSIRIASGIYDGTNKRMYA